MVQRLALGRVTVAQAQDDRRRLVLLRRLNRIPPRGTAPRTSVCAIGGWAGCAGGCTRWITGSEFAVGGTGAGGVGAGGGGCWWPLPPAGAGGGGGTAG